MGNHPIRDRAYLEARLVEEMERGWRYARSFTLLIFKPIVGSQLWREERLYRGLGIVAPLVRASDVVATVDNQTFAVLLVESDALCAQVAIGRIELALSRQPEEPGWEMTTLIYPADSSRIEALPFYVAA